MSRWVTLAGSAFCIVSNRGPSILKDSTRDGVVPRSLSHSGVEARSEMRKSFLLLLLSAVVPGFCLEPARGQGLVIRVVDRAAIPHETLRGAIVQADMVFQKAKVDVDWVSCSATDPSNACNLSSSDPQLVIIIIPHPTRDTPSSPGAFAIADRRINA